MYAQVSLTGLKLLEIESFAAQANQMMAPLCVVTNEPTGDLAIATLISHSGVKKCLHVNLGIWEDAH